jgi:eukaryotic-like serine/threonine-protein kinase
VGQTYIGLGLSDRAIPVLERALAIRQAAFGHERAETFATRINLAAAYLSHNRQEEAIKLYTETWRLMESTLGGSQRLALTCRDNLAHAFWTVGRTADAIQLGKTTRTLMESRLGPDDVDTLICMGNLANAYQSAGKIPEAIELYQETLRRMERKGNAEGAATLKIKNNLAAAYLSVGRTSEAIQLCKVIRGPMESKFGPNHPYTPNCLTNYASACMTDNQRWDEAEQLWRDLLERQRHATSIPPENVANTLAGLARCLLRRDQDKDAEPLLRECLAILEKAVPDGWQPFQVKSLLGVALLGQRNYPDAESLLLEGYEGLNARKTTLPPRLTSYLSEAGARIVLLYDSWGKPEKAALWQKRPETDRSDGSDPPVRGSY